MKPLLLALFLILMEDSHAQQPLRNLVFEGAGIRGIAYAGALAELEQFGRLQQVERVGGTSAGAVTALTLALGYGAGEIRSIVESTPFQKFNDGKYFFVGGIHRVSRYYGWYRGKAFEQWLASIIARKTGNADITFRQLHEQGYRDLYVTGTCLNRQSLIVFSRETYPDMKVRDAVRISMSIPLYFEAVFLDAKGNTYNHPRDTRVLDVLVDGGFIANFPIRIFDSTKYFDSSQANAFAVNPQTLGFRIDRKEQIGNDASGKGLAALPVQDLKTYFGALYNIILESLNRQTLTAEDWARTVSISDGGISPRIRRMPEPQRQLLLHNGSSAARNHLLRE